MSDFYAADNGRTISSGGGYGVITSVIDGQTVGLTVIQPFPSTKLNSGDWVIEGTPLATLTPSAEKPVGATITLTLGIPGWRDSDVGRYVRLNGGLCRIVSKTSDSAVQAVIEVEMGSPVAAERYAWSLEGSVWGGTFGYPRCGTLYQQRLWLAGTKRDPQGFWGSVIGEYFNFLLGTLDDDALGYTLDNGEINPIMHLVSGQGILALTSGGEFSVRGGQEKPITPTNIQVEDQSNFGCSRVPPERVGNEVYFTQRAGRKVRALTANQYNTDQYNSPDMSVLAQHITEGGVVSMAYQQEPESTLYAVRGDGQMATLTADRDQDVYAWARQVTQGRIECVETVPVGDGYRVFVGVARVINGVTRRFIEILDPTLNTDSAITGSSESGATVWSGLGHLEGCEVRVKGDGVLLEDRIVQGGQITIERPAKAIEIGLDYITTVLTLTPEVSGVVNSTQGMQVSIHEAKVRLRDTIGCSINLQEVAFRKLGLAVLDKGPVPFTGDKAAGNLGWGDGVAQVLIQQTLPYNFHLLAVISKLTVNEG